MLLRLFAAGNARIAQFEQLFHSSESRIYSLNPIDRLLPAQARADSLSRRQSPDLRQPDIPYGYSGENSLEQISWDDWFDKFDETNLALLVQDTTARGQKSTFNKLVSRGTAESSSEGRSSTNARRSRANGSQSSRGERRTDTQSCTRSSYGKSRSSRSQSKSSRSSAASRSSSGSRSRKSTGTRGSSRRTTESARTSRSRTTARSTSGKKTSPRATAHRGTNRRKAA